MMIQGCIASPNSPASVVMGLPVLLGFRFTLAHHLSNPRGNFGRGTLYAYCRLLALAVGMLCLSLLYGSQGKWVDRGCAGEHR